MLRMISPQVALGVVVETEGSQALTLLNPSLELSILKQEKPPLRLLYPMCFKTELGYSSTVNTVK